MWFVVVFLRLLNFVVSVNGIHQVTQRQSRDMLRI